MLYDPNYHTANDTYANLNFTAILVNTKAIAAAVAHYDTSFDGLRPRKNTTEVSKRDLHFLDPGSKRQWKNDTRKPLELIRGGWMSGRNDFN